jgi:hypothetical protein
MAGDAVHREPWNTGKNVGQKAPFKLKAPGAAPHPIGLNCCNNVGTSSLTVGWICIVREIAV